MPNETSPASSTTATPHDGLFRMAFADPEIARAQVQAILPPAVEPFVDVDSLRIESGAFVSERLRSRYADILYRIPLTASATGFLWFLLEHFSSPIPFMPVRCLGYETEIWSRHLRQSKRIQKRTWKARSSTKSRRVTKRSKLPAIVPVVLSHHPGGWTSAASFEGLYDLPEVLQTALGDCLIHQRPLIDDLSLCTEEDLAQRSDSAYARLVWWSLRSRGDVEPHRKSAWTKEFRKLIKQDKAGVAHAIMEYHGLVSSQEPPVAIEAAIEASESLKEHALTYAERLQLKGLKKGIEQGLEKGEAVVLLRQLRRRFPDEVGPEVEARVQAASPQVVEVWLDRILTEPTIESVLASVDK